MKKGLLTDYLGYTTVKFLGPVFRALPLALSLFLGRRIGDLFYCFDYRHKALAYANIKTALGDKLGPKEIRRISRKFYRNLGQNIIEVFFIPLLDKKYLDKYVSFEGYEYIEEAFKHKKGVIFTAMHAGSWELSSVICANLGFPFNIFVRDQRYPRLNSLLNSYRSLKGCKIISRQEGLRDLVLALKNNEAVGMTADQGGKNGIPVPFFGREASMPVGAVRLALKYDAVILPSYYTRVKGPYIKAVVAPPFKVKRTGDIERDVRQNLHEIVRIFEGLIAKYPQDYFWPYKIWKYGRDRKVLILNDGKAGHLRQSESVAKSVMDMFKARGMTPQLNCVEIKFKSAFHGRFLKLASCFSGKYQCQGCLFCLKVSLQDEVYDKLMKIKPDVVVSAGSSVAALNYMLSRQNLAKSIVVMRPSFLSMRRFDLVVMPRHDHPPARINVAVTEGALNLVEEGYLKAESVALQRQMNFRKHQHDIYIGLLLGGDTKNFRMDPDKIGQLVKGLKQAAQKLGARILVTTSRRTPPQVEEVLKKEFSGSPECRLLIIANEKNIPEAVGGILGLSDIVVVSPESISMVSEAASSKRYVLVFDMPGLKRKHREFLRHFVKNNYIYLTQPGGLAEIIGHIWQAKPPVHYLEDRLAIAEKLKDIL